MTDLVLVMNKLKLINGMTALIDKEVADILHELDSSSTLSSTADDEEDRRKYSQMNLVI